MKNCYIVTYTKFEEGIDTDGFTQKNKLRLGDLYITRVTKTPLSLEIREVIGDWFYDNKKIWEEKLYPHRIKFRILYAIPKDKQKTGDAYLRQMLRERKISGHHVWSAKYALPEDIVKNFFSFVGADFLLSDSNPPKQKEATIITEPSPEPDPPKKKKETKETNTWLYIIGEEGEEVAWSPILSFGRTTDIDRRLKQYKTHRGRPKVFWKRQVESPEYENIIKKLLRKYQIDNREQYRIGFPIMRQIIDAALYLIDAGCIDNECLK